MTEQLPEGATVAVEPVVGQATLRVEDALLYSRNYANASPYLNNTAREHILGLCDLLDAKSREATYLRSVLSMAREALAEFHQTGDVPTALDEIDAVLLPNAQVEGAFGPKDKPDV